MKPNSAQLLSPPFPSYVSYMYTKHNLDSVAHCKDVGKTVRRAQLVELEPLKFLQFYYLWNAKELKNIIRLRPQG